MHPICRASSIRALVVSTAALGGCTTIDMGEDGAGGIASVGLLSSFETAQEDVKRLCGLDETSSYEPLVFSPYLPVITHTVHAFRCTEPAKDAQ